MKDDNVYLLNIMKDNLLQKLLEKVKYDKKKEWKHGEFGSVD